jgi:hypothetical protein
VSLAGAQTFGVQDECDLFVRVLRRETANEIQNLVGGGPTMLAGPVQLRGEIGSGASRPNNPDIRLVPVAMNSHNHLLDEAAKELLPLPVGGGIGAPDRAQVSAGGPQPCDLLGRERCRTAGLEPAQILFAFS